MFPDGVINYNEDTGYAYASYFVILNSLVPLSMIIVLELIKIFYTKFIELDVEMTGINWQDKEVTTCRVQNMTLHEELAQVNYMFCDKTGTLT